MLHVKKSSRVLNHNHFWQVKWPGVCLPKVSRNGPQSPWNDFGVSKSTDKNFRHMKITLYWSSWAPENFCSKMAFSEPLLKKDSKGLTVTWKKNSSGRGKERWRTEFGGLVEKFQNKCRHGKKNFCFQRRTQLSLKRNTHWYSNADFLP